MIRQIEALNFRSLRYVAQSLSDFQVLIGPNASGKTTFMDAVGFLGDLLEKGLDDAITTRSNDLRDLFFSRQGQRFELAVTMEIPEKRLCLLPEDHAFKDVRYEVSIGIDELRSEYCIFDEQVILCQTNGLEANATQRLQFPRSPEPPETIMHPKQVGKGKKRTVRKVAGGNDSYYSEVEPEKGKGGWAPSIKLGSRKSALANLPDDETKFPVTTWLRETLIHGTQQLMLNSLALRQSSRPGQGRFFKPDGSNLPWVVDGLRHDSPVGFRSWIEHLKTALPDIEDVTVVELPDTRHKFIQVVYTGGFHVPSWMVSDGTLRMLALTLPAYLSNFTGIYMIEEPENGIHPLAMETVFQALKSVYGAQILLATHSPVILGCSAPEEILCFKKDAWGATDIVLGSEHPSLREWQGHLNLADLYASGVLG